MSGIYSLVSAGKAMERKVETSTNNLSNLDTVGYKEDQLTFREVLSTANRIVPESGEEKFLSHEYLDLYVGMDKSSVIVDGSDSNFEMGPLRYTQNPLDLALGTEGFFTIATPQGNRYSRAGQFNLDSQSKIVTDDGFPLLGKNGPITIKGKDIEIDESGSVYVDGNFVDSLKLVRFRDQAGLQKLGRSFYAPISSDNVPKDSDDIKVQQGMVEQSNVSTIKEMVGMIGANRAYESVRKAMSTVDRVDEKAISISRIG